MSIHLVLDFREPGPAGNVGGPVMNGSLQGRNEDILALERAPRVAFLCHGYNVNRDEGRRSLGNLAALLGLGNEDATVSVLWPGDHRIGALSYPFEGRQADDTAGRFARYILQVLRLRPDAEIMFVSHSLGARVILETAKHLAARGQRIGHLCLMAAAVDDTCLANPKYYRTTLEDIGRVAVLASRCDHVLRWAYPAGDLLQAFIFWRDDAGKALGLSGPSVFRKKWSIPPNVMPKQIPEQFQVDHGDYLPGTLPNEKQLSAAAFARAVLAGDPNPQYPQLTDQGTTNVQPVSNISPS